MTATEPHSEDDFRLRSRVTAGLALIMLLVVGGGGWAAIAQINGSIMGRGVVKVDQNIKTIQHRDGGIVSAILVREGHMVREGQVLIRLDDIQTRAELSIVNSQLSELAAKRARLVAERDGEAKIDPRNAAPFETTLAEIAAYGEARIFSGHRQMRESQKEQLRFEIAQLGEEAKGLSAKKDAKVEEQSLVEHEYRKLRDLAAKALVEAQRVHVVARDRARLAGEIGETEAAIARARAKISSINLQIISIDDNARTEAQRELNSVMTKMSELNDRRIAISDRLSRMEIRAPIAGSVNELAVHTVGGVISPAETLATIVPKGADLTIEAKIAPVDIDQVFIGQEARLRFSAFNQSTTPEVKGHVSYVAAAATIDSITRETLYLAHVSVDATEMEKLGSQKLKPGMPVEVFLTTRERTIVSYLVKPLSDQVSKAFREE